MYSKSTETISNILQAAQELFVAKNYADVSMTDIADAAQVTKGALYHHFASKEKLYQQMLLADLQEKRSLLHVAAISAGSSRQRLYRLTLDFLNLPSNKRKLIQLVRRDSNVFKGATRKRLIDAYQAALPDAIYEIVRAGIEQGELIDADARLLTWEYIALVEVILSSYAQEVLLTNERTADFVLDLFFDGARAGAEKIARANGASKTDR